MVTQATAVEVRHDPVMHQQLVHEHAIKVFCTQAPRKRGQLAKAVVAGQQLGPVQDIGSQVGVAPAQPADTADSWLGCSCLQFLVRPRQRRSSQHGIGAACRHDSSSCSPAGPERQLAGAHPNTGGHCGITLRCPAQSAWCTGCTGTELATEPDNPAALAVPEQTLPYRKMQLPCWAGCRHSGQQVLHRDMCREPLLLLECAPQSPAVALRV